MTAANRPPVTLPDAGQPRRRRPANADRRNATLLFLLACVGAALMLTPFYLMLVMSLKTGAEIAENPWALPHAPQWVNYAHTWRIEGTDVTFALFFRNTIVIAVLGTIGATLSSSVVAFGFARLRFPGRDRLFVVLLATMMLPGIVTTIPSYIGFRYLHWIDTFYPLVVPAYFGGAFNVFLLRQFFLTLPRELDEAARLDGASFFQVYSLVLLPLTRPALVTVGLFAFIGHWKDLMGPLIYLNSTEKQTLELGLRTFQTIRGTEWNLLMAGSVIVLIPLLVMFFLGQRYFVQGIVMSGLKD
ncbi:MAG TPA: carbohydrate ABC transporter permease [Armatimonadota bacterium]|jgi:ABC-type glycerol-3-phosphate transport system permease component